VLLVRPMVQSEQRQSRRGRKSTSAALRWLAACLALLLTASSLGQIAHFLVVPHAICAEHGELLELSGSAEHSRTDHAADDGEHRASPFASSEAGAGHDHCELLASGQRQLALPAAALVAVIPAASGCALELPPVTAQRLSLPTLALAPKTSPPRSSSAV
jgi:hypothetical protein